jgi:hypothetical protein
MHTGIWWENQKEGDHQEYMNLGAKKIIKIYLRENL